MRACLIAFAIFMFGCGPDLTPIVCCEQERQGDLGPFEGLPMRLLQRYTFSNPWGLVIDPNAATVRKRDFNGGIEVLVTWTDDRSWYSLDVLNAKTDDAGPTEMHYGPRETLAAFLEHRPDLDWPGAHSP